MNGSFSIVSSKDIDLSGDYEKVKDEVTGTDSTHIVIVFPTGRTWENYLLKNAIEKVMEEENIDFLMNATYQSQLFYIPLIYGRVKLTITGEGWRAKG